MNISELVELIQLQGSKLAEPVEVSGQPPMVFTSSLADRGATEDELSALPDACPEQLVEFWREFVSARLFEDQTYGQWGLEILDPLGSLKATAELVNERQHDMRFGDLVVGKFVGDSDLLIVRCDRDAADFGAVLIALPLDPRDDWDIASNSFSAFLNSYVTSGGEKFWSA